MKWKPGNQTWRSSESGDIAGKDEDAAVEVMSIFLKDTGQTFYRSCKKTFLGGERKCGWRSRDGVYEVWLCTWVTHTDFRHYINKIILFRSQWRVVNDCTQYSRQLNIEPERYLRICLYWILEMWTMGKSCELQRSYCCFKCMGVERETMRSMHSFEV